MENLTQVKSEIDKPANHVKIVSITYPTPGGENSYDETPRAKSPQRISAKDPVSLNSAQDYSDFTLRIEDDHARKVQQSTRTENSAPFPPNKVL